MASSRFFRCLHFMRPNLHPNPSANVTMSLFNRAQPPTVQMRGQGSGLQMATLVTTPMPATVAAYAHRLSPRTCPPHVQRLVPFVPSTLGPCSDPVFASADDSCQVPACSSHFLCLPERYWLWNHSSGRSRFARSYRYRQPS